jgi:ApaG protein
MIDKEALYSTISENIKISVTPLFVAEKSRPEQNFYLFKYRVIVTNKGNEKVQLLSRCWKIRNGNQKEELVRGPGVVGKTPVLAPNESFSYESFCPLSTPTGNMRGYFEFMILRNQTKFQANIPLFFLRLDN